MVYKTKKEYIYEKRLELFQKKFIRTTGTGGTFNSISVEALFSALVPWFYQISDDLDMTPILVTITFRDIPKGEKGYYLINSNMNEFYSRTILPYLVHRQRHHQYKDQ